MKKRQEVSGKSILDATGVPVPRDHVSTEVAIKGMRGYTLIEHVPKSSFKDCSMVVLVPSRTAMLHVRFVEAYNAIQWIMNGKRAAFFITGDEVGRAYSDQIKLILEHPELKDWKYILTIEDDMLVPPDCVYKLCESIEMGPFDGVGAMYHTKSNDIPMPMAYGSPEEYARTGHLDFRPRDVVAAMKAGNVVMEVNGVANGCTLFRMDSFRKVPGPWFETSPNATQDLAWCGKARRAGMRFACDLRVRCGHANWQTGEVF